MEQLFQDVQLAVQELDKERADLAAAEADKQRAVADFNATAALLDAKIAAAAALVDTAIAAARDAHAKFHARLTESIPGLKPGRTL